MITYNPTGRGTYFRAYQFARELGLLQHSVTLLTTAPTRKTGIKFWEEEGIQIVEFPAILQGGARSGWDLLNIYSRLSWLNSKSFDIVYGFESRPSVIYPALKLAHRGIPLVLDWCDWFGKGGSVEERPNPILRLLLRPFETYFENHFRKNAKATSVISNTLYQRALDLGVNQETLTLIPNGFNIPGWKPIRKSHARINLGFPEDEFIIGYVGSLFPKDAILLSRAFSLVHMSLPNARLLHLGQSNYFPQADSQIENNITITGNVDEKTLQVGLSACDVCWLPMSDVLANWGRFPLKFSNYLSASKPVIVTNVGDIPEIVEQHNVGLICAPDEIALSDVTTELALNPQDARNFEFAAEQLSQNPEFSWKYQTKKILEVFNHLI